VSEKHEVKFIRSVHNLLSYNIISVHGTILILHLITVAYIFSWLSEEVEPKVNMPLDVLDDEFIWNLARIVRDTMSLFSTVSISGRHIIALNSRTAHPRQSISIAEVTVPAPVVAQTRAALVDILAIAIV
jgi:hypothetical protein